MRKMKDSGVEWIGEIPEDWKISRTKHLFKIHNGATPTSQNVNFWDGDISWVTPADYSTSDMFVSSGKKTITTEGLNSCGTTLVPANSLIISNRAPIGAVAITKNELCTNQGCKSLIAANAKSIKYYYYFFSVMTMPLNSLGRGTTFLELSSFDLGDFYLPIPNEKEQNQIAGYLDKKTSAIDVIVSEKQNLISLLKEQRQAIIMEAVTKGLDHTVPMKDSGVEWIGEIPAHWEIQRLKHLVALRSDKSSNSSLQYIGLENVESFTCRLLREVAPEKDDDKIQANLFYKGDVLFGKLRPYLCKAFNASFDGHCSGEFLVLNPILLEASFLLNILVSRGFIDIVNSSTYGSKMPRANWDFIGNMQLSVPPKKEQQIIAAHIDEKTFTIDTLIADITTQIEKLKEYRQSLIYEAVTGKIEI